MSGASAPIERDVLAVEAWLSIGLTAPYEDSVGGRYDDALLGLFRLFAFFLGGLAGWFAF